MAQIERFDSGLGEYLQQVVLRVNHYTSGETKGRREWTARMRWSDRVSFSPTRLHIACAHFVLRSRRDEAVAVQVQGNERMRQRINQLSFARRLGAARILPQHMRSPLAAISGVPPFE